VTMRWDGSSGGDGFEGVIIIYFIVTLGIHSDLMVAAEEMI
jgi:hypothetical protein